MFVLQDTDLRCSGTRLLNFFLKDFLTVYCWALPSLERPKSFHILLVLLGLLSHNSICQLRNILLYPGPFLLTVTTLRTLRLTSMNRLGLPLFSSPWYGARKLLTQQQACRALGQDPASQEHVICHSCHWFRTHNLCTLHPGHQASTSVATCFSEKL